MKNSAKKVLGSLVGFAMGIAIIYLIVVVIAAFVSGDGFVATVQASGTWFSKLF